MAIASLIGLGMQMVGSSGILDKSYTQTVVDYDTFGNFAEAGKKPGIASGQTSRETEETVTHTGISDMFSMAGSMLPAVAGAFESMDSSMRAGGATGVESYYSPERKAGRQANRAERQKNRANRKAARGGQQPIYDMGNVPQFDPQQYWEFNK